MKHTRIAISFLILMVTFPAFGQESSVRSRLDTLIGKGQYATAYPLAQEQYRKSPSASGPEQLEAAFYLTVLDYAYSKNPVDSALLRFRQLTQRLQGVDRAVAYTFLFQIYSTFYNKQYQRLAHRRASDDPNLKYPQWHLSRLEDTLMACADRVLVCAERLRHASPQPYGWMWIDSNQAPVMDSSLLGMLVQTLLAFSGNYVNTETVKDGIIPYPLALHQRVAQLYADGTADMKLWLELQRLAACYYTSSFLTVLDSLSSLYGPHLQSDEMKALLNLHRAEYLNAESRKVEAEQTCMETEKTWPDTYGALLCRNLRHVICEPKYEIHYSNPESSRRSRMACVEARNVKWIDFRLVKSELVPYRMERDGHMDSLLLLPAEKEWRQEIPDPGDHLTHQYIIELPAMPQGNYYLVASTDSSFAHDRFESDDVTSIRYFGNAAPRKNTNFQPSSGHLVDRLTGQPLAGKRVTLNYYGEMSGRDYFRHCRTDKDGFFQFPASSVRYLFMGGSHIYAEVDGHEHDVTNYWECGHFGSLPRSRDIKIIMTDHPVYRLGDTVRFSCVAYRRKERGKEWRTEMRPASRVKLVACLGMSYGEIKDTLMLTTDKYGRCWGEFVIPADGRNGRYTLEVKSPESKVPWTTRYYDSRDIKVEAYKPPRFMVSLSTTADDTDTTAATVRRFGQPCTVYGTAMSYSGAPMTGAKVRWEVSHERMDNPLQMFSVANEYPYHDSLTVGDDGLFQFTFTPEKDSGTMIYVAHVTVTDADGELHEQKLSFRVSDTDGYCMIDSDDLCHLSCVYNNFDHQPLKGAVRVELFQLRQPDTLRTLDPIMQRYPEARWVGSREDFYRVFPNRAFSREEGDCHAWPVVAKRYDRSTDERQLNIGDLPSGLYRVRFTTPDGTRYDTLVNHVAPGGRVTGNDMVWVRTTPKQAWGGYCTVYSKVGDTVRFELGSPYGNQPLYYYVHHAAKTYQRGMIMLDSCSTTMLTVPVTAKMKDGCEVALTTIRDGRWFSKIYTVKIDRPDQRLGIVAETFRDRLQPGQREQWRFRIVDADTAGAVRGREANLVLTMFDKSLEQYGNQQYGFWPWSPRYSRLRVIGEEENDGMLNGLWQGMGNRTVVTLQSKPAFGFSLPLFSDYHRQILFIQNPGSIKGTVVDGGTGEPLPFVNIMLKRNGKQVAACVSDIDGIFVMQSVPAGEYVIETSCMGYKQLQQRIFIGFGMPVLNIKLSSGVVTLNCVEIVEHEIPYAEKGDPESGSRMTSEDIARMPGSSIDEIVAAVGGMGYSGGENGLTTMQGNVRKRTGIAVPKSAIAEISERLQFGNSTSDDVSANVRKNLSTLAFFEPALRSDKEGRVDVSFVMPDGLTQWQVCGFAWTDQFQVGITERVVNTQKELMVQPQLPRFLRQGDTAEIRAKMANLTDSTMVVEVTLDVEKCKMKTEKEVAAHSSAIVTFVISVGRDWQVANYKIVARNIVTTQGHLIDGEQGQLPVLSNRERVTQSRLLYIAGTSDSTHPSSAEFHFSTPNLQLPLDSLAISFHPNPIEYAIQALPHFKRHRMPGNLYLANSIYVNHLSSQLAPMTEKERARSASRVKDDLRQLLSAQTSQGGWSWMPKGKSPSLHITEAILQRLATCPSLWEDDYRKMYYLTAISYLDKELVRQYQGSDSPQRSAYFSPLSLLYTRSFYLDQKPIRLCDSVTRQAYDHYYRLCREQMSPLGSRSLSLIAKAQTALLMLRMGDTAAAVELANRIKGSAHTDDTLGMYWVDNVSGYGWYQRPIETAAVLVDVFADVLHDWESVGRIQQWILASKQGTTWKTDMATAHALAALVKVESGKRKVEKGKVATLTVNGVPHTEFSLGANDALPNQPSTLNVQLANPTPYPAWGALFVCREIPLDSIPHDGTGISLRKTLSRVDADGSLHLIGENNDEVPLRVGDRVRVHIDIHCQRDMDNMVLSDQRAAAFESVSTASGWFWNDGLRYYVDVRDDRLDCYIDRLTEGHYYVEYDLWVRHAGTFVNGIGVLRSVYAPELRANTSSVLLKVQD